LDHLSCNSNKLNYYPITNDDFKQHNKFIKRKEILKRICV